ncbi:MAG: zinc-ribbon domain-containing protein [Acidobacteria bacterium]|nr:zinc-ribbon domain-containing protein [Acidobacteriota bacterium]
MVPCRDCGQEVAENAEFCPYCGATQAAPIEVAPEQQELALESDSEGDVSEDRWSRMFLNRSSLQRSR